MSDSHHPSSSAYNTHKSQCYDDDSFESCTSYSDEFLQFSPTLKLHPRLSSTFKHNQPPNIDHTYRFTQSNKENTTQLSNEQDLLNNLSVWEQWLVAKLKLEKEKSKAKKIQAKLDQEEKKKAQKIKEERKSLAMQRHQEWLDDKLVKIKLQKSNEKRQEQIKKEIELEKAAKLKADTELNFKSWMEKHRDIDRQKRLKEKEQKEKEVQLKEDKKQKAEENFKKWLRENKERIAALNFKEPATPSYVNPVPWVGPDQDEARRRREIPPRPQSSREPKRSFNYSARRCSTPKPRSRGLDTHTPLRTGRAPQNTSSAGLVRFHTPLRFSGYRPKSETKSECRRPKSSSVKHLTVPQPLVGIPKSMKHKR